MLGNMIELKSPTSKMLHIAACPDVNTEAKTSAAAAVAKIPSSVPVATPQSRSDKAAHHGASPVEAANFSDRAPMSGWLR